ncbi:hypothetical protein [Mycolicibacterium arenosum]|uniref:Uncharacterized protein n=1 Tax=Mycolicibacterium arenosum TaxID=2952157 RepID=A0ABT1M0E1_9MYCO|nr:hypothetical protein [Mycolicibacterium sp. CAU 1645]MCP9271724.1 hypothetical protein [Mycolicibacterium sp. CAU 1645]
MPLQNRVTPRGELIAATARGMYMGNRGRLHDDQRRIVRAANSMLWIICVLDFKGRRREVMTPGRYTELFFLDEAVALAAGHRPCAECRRSDYRAYLQAVRISGAPELNERLRESRDADRIIRDVDALPDGVFVLVDDQPRLKWQGALRRWTPAGYVDPVPVSGVAPVVTPDLSVTALRNGYRPVVHPSVGA